ncbi:MAG: DNA-binding domain-containing protein [Gammaproteobacteria bacterium]
MPSLTDLQSIFTGYLISPPDTKANARLIEAIRPSSIAAEQRLKIYKNNVYVRLIEALEAAYPAVQRLVGHRFFRFAARAYIPAHPPRSRTLIGYGADFSDFLARFEAAASVPYLADVARLEQLYLEAYHAAEAPTLTMRAPLSFLENRSEEFGLSLHPSARLMTSAFPVSRIWELNRSDIGIDGEVEIPGGGENLLIVRPHAEVEVRRISRGAYAMLTALADGASIAAAQRAGREAEPGCDLNLHLSALIKGGSFCACGSKKGR